ncbi:AEC family transporter [Adlercreutzia sp. ZJ242]|uniref:AEC family transporter n=1 Tax=Adlercreutzia sp. ZJ242 TaxID=2709409 RepID=UPI0013EC2249|nr:AEC family transporter [Adlercreutzia sp. ZJ242]
MTIFFAILLVGFVAGKAGVIKKDFMPGFARLITKVLLPCLIFYATVTGCTRQAMADNLPMLGLSAGFYALIVCITLLSALPTMTIVPMIASQRGDFGDYAAGITVGTLVFSLVTIPLVTFLVL